MIGLFAFKASNHLKYGQIKVHLWKNSNLFAENGYKMFYSTIYDQINANT